MIQSGHFTSYRATNRRTHIINNWFNQDTLLAAETLIGTHILSITLNCNFRFLKYIFDNVITYGHVGYIWGWHAIDSSVNTSYLAASEAFKLIIGLIIRNSIVRYWRHVQWYLILWGYRMPYIFCIMLICKLATISDCRCNRFKCPLDRLSDLHGIHPYGLTSSLSTCS